MTKIKKFGLSHDLNKGFSETINIVENHSSKYRNTIIPISRIELDPHNPRSLAITLNDLIGEINLSDPDYSRKQNEIMSIREFSKTIEQNGLINPITVYKLEDKYRLIAGERRTMASILIGKSEIEARVFSEKPNVLELKLVQWAENNAREDLTLAERIINIRDIIDVYLKSNNSTKITGVVLSELTGLNNSQASNYLSILRNSKDVLAAVLDGSINNLEKAVLINGITDELRRKKAIDMVVKGISLSELKHFIKNFKPQNKEKSLMVHKTLFKLGSTNELKVIKILVDAVTNLPDFHNYSNQFDAVNWDSEIEVINTFKKLIKLLEKNS